MECHVSYASLHVGRPFAGYYTPPAEGFNGRFSLEKQSKTVVGAGRGGSPFLTAPTPATRIGRAAAARDERLAVPHETMHDNMPTRRFDAVLIDFYGTIAAGDREAVEATCRTIVESLGLPIPAAQFAVIWGGRYFETVGQSSHASYRTLYECELISLRDTLAAFGHHSDPAPFLLELENYWHTPPMHEDAVEFLRDLDLPVCCVSNADHVPLHSAIARGQLRFDAVISSQAVRCYKPQPAIFEHALQALGVRADQAIHVGDSLHSDVSGASALGIATAWIRREDRIHDIGCDTPSFTIASLAELASLLA